MNSPAWNIESEYTSISSNEFQKDFAFVVDCIARINEDSHSTEITVLQDLFILHETASIVLANLRTYVSCTLSVNATDEAAKSKKSEIESLDSRLQQATTPLTILIKTCHDSVFESLLQHSKLDAHRFLWTQKRKTAPFLLTKEEEILLAALETSGHSAWGNLYESLCGTMKCHLKYPEKTETVGLAQAQAMVFQKDPVARKIAWEAVQEAWTLHRESAAAILNALSGWRHEVNSKRSHHKEFNFLDTPLLQNHIQKETLQAMIEACYANVEKSRTAATTMAKIMKKNQLDPWDLLAPSPLGTQDKSTSFEDAIKLIREAFKKIDPKMSEFVDMMVRNKWIEARILPNKTTGAYCTEFHKSREPRVYMTYMGSDQDISTLAHELGHAFHSWTVRDLPYAQTHYPMTLAETASIFAETVLREELFERAYTIDEKIDAGWSELESVAGFLINIPSRFEFEKNFYEKRRHSTLSPDQLSQLMDEAWTKWYGSVLSKNDRMFWASKLHFSIAGDWSFYNFPYSFGYLFSLSIYARRKELGSNFMQTYINILRDTGRMTAEELIRKHFNEDITKPQFWQKSIDMVLNKIKQIEELANQLD